MKEYNFLFIFVERIKAYEKNLFNYQDK